MMNPTRPTVFSSVARATLAVLAIALSQAFGLPGAPAPKNPPAQAGVSIEFKRMKVPATAKFTNDTAHELAFFYGPEKFSLKPGDSTSVPIPKPNRFDLRIFETLGKGKLRERFRGQATPDDPDRVIPLTFAKPKEAR